MQPRSLSLEALLAMDLEAQEQAAEKAKKSARELSGQTRKHSAERTKAEAKVEALQRHMHESIDRRQALSQSKQVPK